MDKTEIMARYDKIRNKPHDFQKPLNINDISRAVSEIALIHLKIVISERISSTEYKEWLT